MTSNKILLVAALLLPVIGLSAVVAQKEIDTQTAKTWRVKIKGYDPRHPLYGHYIQFQYDWTIGGTCNPVTESCALCLTGNESAPVASIERTDSTPTKCASSVGLNPLFLRIIEIEKARLSQGHPSFSISYPDRFDLPTRYYIPEAIAPTLDKTFRERGMNASTSFSVDLKITKEGRAYISEMYIDNTPWRQWLESSPNITPPQVPPVNPPPPGP